MSPLPVPPSASLGEKNPGGDASSSSSSHLTSSLAPGGWSGGNEEQERSPAGVPSLPHHCSSQPLSHALDPLSIQKVGPGGVGAKMYRVHVQDGMSRSAQQTANAVGQGTVNIRH